MRSYLPAIALIFAVGATASGGDGCHIAFHGPDRVRGISFHEGSSLAFSVGEATSSVFLTVDCSDRTLKDQVVLARSLAQTNASFDVIARLVGKSLGLADRLEGRIDNSPMPAIPGIDLSTRANPPRGSTLRFDDPAREARRFSQREALTATKAQVKLERNAKHRADDAEAKERLLDQFKSTAADRSIRRAELVTSLDRSFAHLDNTSRDNLLAIAAVNDKLSIVWDRQADQANQQHEENLSSLRQFVNLLSDARPASDNASRPAAEPRPDVTHSDTSDADTEDKTAVSERIINKSASSSQPVPLDQDRTVVAPGTEASPQLPIGEPPSNPIEVGDQFPVNGARYEFKKRLHFYNSVAEPIVELEKRAVKATGVVVVTVAAVYVLKGPARNFCIRNPIACTEAAADVASGIVAGVLGEPTGTPPTARSYIAEKMTLDVIQSIKEIFSAPKFPASPK